MEELLMYLGICFLFIAGYEFIVLRGRKNIIIFFSVIEILLVYSLVKTFHLDIGNFASTCTFQIFFLLFVRNHIKNTSRTKIYHAVSNTSFTPIIFSGLKDLDEKEYEEIYKVINRTLVTDVIFQKPVFLMCSYLDKELFIRYLFCKKEDYYLYQQKRVLEIEHIEEAEERGKGACLVYKVVF